MAKNTLRCLVTGGAGFVGSHLVDRLHADGHHVVALDDFYTGSCDNLAHLQGERRFQLLEREVCEPFDDLPGAFDRIYHLACPASPPHYQKDPIFTLRTSFLGTIHALELAKRDRARMVNASTSEVYGDPKVHPQPESYCGYVDPMGPRSCYDEGKRASEALCAAYARRHGVNVRVARIFNTYGPRMNPDDGRVVSNFVAQALSGEPITIYGHGNQTRSFCYVSDLVEGLVRLSEHPEPLGPVNLGNPGEYTVAELAREILRQTRSRSRLVYRDLPGDDPKRRRPDIRLAEARLGYAPTVPLTEGLARTIAWFERQGSPTPAMRTLDRAAAQ